MTKIVYNDCFGGFGLSQEAIDRYWELKKKPKPDDWDDYDLDRDDKILVKVVEELGDDASGPSADLKIRNLKKGTLYRIDEYDGLERVETQDGYEWKVA